MGKSKDFPINTQLREQLKHPLGRLIPDNLISVDALARYFRDSKVLTVCIGDRTTERIHEFGFSPNLEIVDSLEKRKRRELPKLSEIRTILRASNPPGVITEEALLTISIALKMIIDSSEAKVRIEISGEEDLLTLPVVAFFPESTFALYGQPNEGMVIVASKDGRSRSRATLLSMGISSLSKN